VEVFGAGLIGDIVKRARRYWIRLGDSHSSHFAGVGVLVSECCVTSFPADRDVAMLGERFEDLFGKNVVRTTSVEPRRIAGRSDLDVDPELFKICVGIVDHLAVSEVAI